MGILVLTGTNDYARRAALKGRIDQFVSEHGDFGLERIDGSEVAYGRLLESISSLPFLASRRMIVLTNPAACKGLVDDPDTLIGSVADTTDLVIEERKFDKRLVLYKTLKKQAVMEEYGELDENAVASWLVDEAARRGGSLSLADARVMIARLGTDQLNLSNELDKLLLFDVKISRSSIELLTEPLPQSSVFDLLDAAFTGDKKRTLELYKDQRKQQVEPQAIMGMIAWQVHILAIVKFNERNGVDATASAAKLNPYVVRKTLSLVRNLSQQQVKDLVNRAVQLDVRLKSQPVDADDAVQHFLLTI